MSKSIQKLINDPDDLISELIDGMTSAHPNLICRRGKTGRAIVAKNGPRPSKVGIVIGGGSGHEPAFAGYVGRGLADAAPLGNIFASPSPTQIKDAVYEADGGAGVLMLYGNYTGDVMNFDMAAEELASEGIEAESFVVTDDIASAPVERSHERRGIAGDFFVFKVAGAAADMGLSFEDVKEAAVEANAATRTMGVALSPCSMPQTGKANFEIPDGMMEIGMGIHGEPGVEQLPIGTADDVTERLMSPIIGELALSDGDEVAVLVNGLGATTLLELYVIHRKLSSILDEKGVSIHFSWVGEYCTSLEMAGASISLLKLSDRLKSWLDHPCQTPALQVGKTVGEVSKKNAPERAVSNKTPSSAAVDHSNLATGGKITPDVFRSMMQSAARDIFAASDHLSELDGAIGDGDHGVTMTIGWQAVLKAMEALRTDATISQQCDASAQAFLDAVGASAGPLYASAFQSAGRAVSNRLNLDAGSIVLWIEGMAEGIQSRGKAEVGEKTMLDAWFPACTAARSALDEGLDAEGCLSAAAEAARRGASDTKEMVSQRGRSKVLGDRSIGHIDAGAVSAAGAMPESW